MSQPLILNIGSGKRPIQGFINIDLDAKADIQADVRNGLPYDAGTVDAIYSEHFFEHLSQNEGLAFLRECRRVLRPGGVVRLAMPDLDELVRRYGSDDWRGDGDMFRMGYEWVDNRCEMLNLAMREWGHKWVYNEEELVRVAELAGFASQRRMDWGVSDVPELRQREYRTSSKLVMELVKTLPIYADAPLVSVLIPAYRATYLAEALTSVANQTYPNVEIIVCDDCRDGSVKAMVDRANAQGAGIQYHYNTERLGGRYNLVKCFSLATGEFVKFLNDDDVLLPTCIERMVKVFRDNPDVTLVTSHRQLVDEQTRPLPDVLATRPIVAQDSRIDGVSLANLAMRSGINCIGEPSTLMFPRRALLKVKPHFVSFGGRELPGIGDLAAWLNLLSRGDVVYTRETLSCFRMHADQHQRHPEMRQEGETSWQHLRFHAQRLGLFPSREHDVLLSQPLGSDTWQRTDLANLYPEVINREAAGAQPAKMTNAELYDIWRLGHAMKDTEMAWLQESAERWTEVPRFHFAFIVPEGREGALGRTFQSFVEMLYPEAWKITIVSSQPSPEGIAGNPLIDWRTSGNPKDGLAIVNAALSESDADWVGMLEAGDKLDSRTLFTLAEHSMRHGAHELLYSDEDSVDDEDRHSNAYFKPDFSIDLCRSAPYAIGGLMVLRRKLFAALGGFRPEAEGVEYWDLLLRAYETAGSPAIGHIATVLYHRYIEGGHTDCEVEELESRRKGVLESHLARMNQAAVVGDGLLPGTFHVFYKHTRQPLVSVIIPTKDLPDMIRRCVQGLLDKTNYSNIEVLVVDNGTTDPDALAFLEEIGRHPKVRVLPYPHAYNYSAMNNLAAREARGEFLLLLNNDTAVLHEQWLDEMVSHGLRSDVGVVGARLLFPDGRVQHGGIIAGLLGLPGEHIFLGSGGEAPGYFGRAQLTQDFSAVTAACLLVRKELYHEVGALDEDRFKVGFNDLDFCLRVRRRGLRIVWTPFATLLHEGSKSQREDLDGNKSSRLDQFQVESQHMFDKWPNEIALDPAYNRNLSLHDCSVLIEIAPALTWDPEWRPRPRILAHTADRMGCGEYRIISPMRALNAAGKVQGWETGSYISVPELLRMAPDSIVIQRQVTPEQLELFGHYVRNSKAFRVFEIDDLITNVPIKNPRKSHFVASKDLHKHFRKAISLCDRLVVSTDYLAQEYQGYTDEVVAVPNFLERAVWGDFQPSRRQSAKPRVGWAGSPTHHGDLDIIVDVVKVTAGEVDWVFFGMCPDELKPLVAEFHPPVTLDAYPAKLASLNLDLAVAPLEDVPFNHGKSHLRLLEYGVLGYPVVCTDITPYRGAYPVTRVPNKFKDWVDAIREHVADLDELARRGDALRDHIRDNWMLEDNLDVWLRAWLPS